MKKLLVFTAFAALLSFTSCKKDWVCECSDNNMVKTYHSIEKATIHDADKTCNNWEYSNDTSSYNNCSVIR